jgi:autoinducer 2-degrading protein
MESDVAEMTIIVEFETHAGREEQFLALLRDHALRTRQEEAGCLRFDIVRPLGEDRAPIANRILLCEIYADGPALAAHERNPRLPGFRAATAPLLKSRRLVLGRSIDVRTQDGLTPEELNASNDR